MCTCMGGWFNQKHAHANKKSSRGDYGLGPPPDMEAFNRLHIRRRFSLPQAFLVHHKLWCIPAGWPGHGAPLSSVWMWGFNRATSIRMWADVTNSGRHGALSLTSLYCLLLAGLKGTGLMPVAVASLLLVQFNHRTRSSAPKNYGPYFPPHNQRTRALKLAVFLTC